MTRPRVVITGIGGVTPLANDMETTWKKLLAGESGIAPITLFDASAFDSRIAGEVKAFNPEGYMTPKQARHMDRFTQFAVASARMLLADSGYEITEKNAFDVGVILGIGLGGLHTLETWHAKLLSAGPNKISPFMIPMLISNMGPGQISIFTGAKGANIVTTTACASALHALGTAYSEILLGRATAVITGGVEEIRRKYGNNNVELVWTDGSGRHTEVLPRETDGTSTLRTYLEKDGVQINSYKELMPRMNDIFIKLVTEGEE